MNDDRFDKLLAGIRDEEASPEQIDGARQRVWGRLTGSQTQACEQVRPALAAYSRGRLGEARRLLVEDHLSRCVDCRHALAEVKDGPKVAPARRPRRTAVGTWARWAVAAGIVVAILYMGRGSIDSALAPGGPRATVVTVSGSLYELSGAALTPGSTLAEGEVVRTAAGSRALLQLADGSRLEMNQRTELALRGAWSGDTVRLDRGDIILGVTKQGLGRLRVVTRDSIADARGTVFAVSSGTAGSLVSVVEGSVAVSQPGFEKLLAAGQQAASSPTLGQVGVQQAVSWSQDAEQYYGLLAELASIEEQLAAMPEALRHDDALVSYMPANTFIYVAIPNLDDTIGEALYLVDQRSWQSPALRDWWESSDGREMRGMLEHMQAITPMLGDEMVFTMSGDANDPMVLMLARIQSGREQQLREALAALGGDSGETIPYQISGDLLLVGANPADVALLSVQLGSGAASPFAAEIRQRYGSGVGWLAGFDVRVVTAEGFRGDQGAAVADALGLANMRYLFLEQRGGSVGAQSEATLTFEGRRTGIASWLAAPGAMGSVEYISADAISASSGSTRDPREAFDQLLSAFGPGSEFTDGLREFEYETGISMADDIASSLGTDFVIAIERPTVPVPGWVAVLEVLNPGALDESMRRFVAAFNASLQPEGAGYTLSFLEESVNGRSWKSLSSGDPEFPGLSWTYDHGYLVAAADRALALRAIGVRDSGTSLVRSAAFQQQYPLAGGLHSSGFFWLNANGVVSQLAQLTGNPAIAGLAGDRDPILMVLTADDSHMHWASRTRLSSMLLDLMMSRPITDVQEP